MYTMRQLSYWSHRDKLPPFWSIYPSTVSVYTSCPSGGMSKHTLSTIHQLNKLHLIEQPEMKQKRMKEICGKIERHISILRSHEAVEVQIRNLHKASLGDMW
jgi:hypothetical protein